jgi:hypothetical protein
MYAKRRTVKSWPLSTSIVASTRSRASRLNTALCGLSIYEVDVVLTALVASGYLSCDRSGQYAVASSQSPDVARHGCEAHHLETTH